MSCEINSAFRRGKRIGVDVGGARVGIAQCDYDAILATPVATAHREKNDFATVIELTHNADVLEVIVGLPLNMDGTRGKSAKEAIRWAKRLSRMIKPIPVRMFDERLSTVSAHSQLHEAGRKEISHRIVIDQVAAVIILENALNFERLTGRPPGFEVNTESGEASV